jgi:hypothetical protein
MNAAEQLTFWEEPVTEQKIIWMELEDLKSKQNNLRRGLFGRFDELQKEIDLLRNQISFLTSAKLEG